MRRKHGGGRVFRVLMGLLAVIVLTGCASHDDARTRLRESEGHYKEGVSFLETDQQRAFVAFQKAIALNPQNFDAHYALGSIYFKRKELIEAEREFRVAAELDPNNGETLNYLGRTLMLQGRGPEAIVVLKKVTTLPFYGKPDIAFTDLGAVLESEGDVAGAVEAYKSALKTDPPNIPRSFIYLWLGRLYMKQGDIPKAQSALSQAKALDPDGTVGTEAARLIHRLDEFHRREAK
jgi:Tfp pilus assembly protein PilF